MVDVLICGAGAAGLTLAIDLARRGVSFRLIDKIDGPFQGSRGKGIQPRTQEVFEDLGIIGRIMALGRPYPPQRVYQEDGTHIESAMMEHADWTPAEPYPMPLMLPQFLTEGVMRDRLLDLGHSPEFGCELVGFDQDDTGVTAHVASRSGTETLRARYLIGADGGRSFVRHALGIDFPGKTLGVRALVADLSLSGIDRDAWHRFNNGSTVGQISLCPLAGTELFQLQASIPLDGDINLSAAGLNQMVAERTGRRDISIHSVLWASAFTMNARLADQYQRGRVFLAGDAAHTHPPTGGQGLNTSIQDSYNLGWKLAAVIAGASDALLDTYEAERRPIAAGMLGLATKLLGAAAQGEMRRGREVHQLDLGYQDSCLSVEVPQRQSGIRAGDRAPDAPIHGADGQPMRLFELFKGHHWTLIGYDIEHDITAPGEDLHIHTLGPSGDIIDHDGHFSDAYGLTAGDWILVRPDGYVGAIVGANEAAAMEAYRQRVGL